MATKSLKTSKETLNPPVIVGCGGHFRKRHRKGPDAFHDRGRTWQSPGQRERRGKSCGYSSLQVIITWVILAMHPITLHLLPAEKQCLSKSSTGWWTLGLRDQWPGWRHLPSPNWRKLKETFSPRSTKVPKKLSTGNGSENPYTKCIWYVIFSPSIVSSVIV